VSENTSTLSTEQIAKQIVDYQIANPKVELYADDLKRMYDEIVMKNTKGLFN
jgi:hypothetical protein